MSRINSIGSRRPERANSRLLRLLSLLLTMLLVSACVSEEREQEMGDLMAVDINAQVPLVQDPVINGFISNLGNVLAKASDRPELDYHFYVINVPIVNAFALPGGHIYLTRGLIEQTGSGTELAAALAHEIGHVAERHGVHKMERELRTGSVVGMLYNLILGGEPEILQQDALELGGALWSARHSRKAEVQADERAIEYLQRVGIDPQAMVDLLEKLHEVERRDSSVVAGWFASHPMTTERIAQASREIDDTEGKVPIADEVPLALLPEFLDRYPIFLDRLANTPGPSFLP